MSWNVSPEDKYSRTIVNTTYCRWVASVLQFSLASSLMSWKLPPVSPPPLRANRQYSTLHGESDEVCTGCRQHRV